MMLQKTTKKCSTVTPMSKFSPKTNLNLKMELFPRYKLLEWSTGFALNEIINSSVYLIQVASWSAEIPRNVVCD